MPSNVERVLDRRLKLSLLTRSRWTAFHRFIRRDRQTVVVVVVGIAGFVEVKIRSVLI